MLGPGTGMPSLSAYPDGREIYTILVHRINSNTVYLLTITSRAKIQQQQGQMLHQAIIQVGGQYKYLLT